MLRGVLVVSLLALGGFACAGNPRCPPSAPQLTSAVRPLTLTEPELVTIRQALARAEAERDAALRQARAEKAQREQEERALQERINFERRTLIELEQIDRDLQPLMESVASVPPQTKVRIEEIARKRDEILDRLRRVHDEPADTWVQFAVETDVMVDDLKRAINGALGR